MNGIANDLIGMEWKGVETEWQGSAQTRNGNEMDRVELEQISFEQRRYGMEVTGED